MGVRKSWEEIYSIFDSRRIRNIALPEKFRLIEFIKMIAQEASALEANNYKGFPNNYEKNKDHTYRMLIYLYEIGVDIEDFKQIVVNYLDNYEFSDIYYAKFAILGMGIILFYEERKAFTIFNALLSLLGQEFLTYNLKYYGYKNQISSMSNPESIIRYKEYETKFRKVKYDLLAMNYLAKEEGTYILEKYIKEFYNVDKMSLFFSLLYDIEDDFREGVYQRLQRDADSLDKMILTGIYCILKGKNIIVSHYYLNSIIGKYDHSGERPQKVKDEAYQRYEEMLHEMEK